MKTAPGDRRSRRSVRAGRHEAEARERFNDWSESPTFRRLGSWLRSVQAHALDEVDWSRTSRVLDVACGSGWAVFEAARRMRSQAPGFAVGCDISEDMIQKREHASSPPVGFAVGSAQAIPFRDRAFDAVFCTAAFHHFPEPLAALIEFRRVVRPGGLVLITDTCRDQALGIWVWDRIHRWFEKGHVKYYRRDELRALLGEAGFADVRVTELEPSFAETRKLVRRVALFRAVAPPG